MKKMLITISTFVFASSAFAVDVSAYALSAYYKSNDYVSLYSDTEVYLSGSKTLPSGLTYGATYTIGFRGASASSTSMSEAIAGRDPALEIVEGTTKSAQTGIKASDVISRNDLANINAYISGVFGEVEMGHHSSASKALGAASIAAGESIDAGMTADDTGQSVDNAITYTSPTAYGAQFAYTYVPENNNIKSMAAKYTGKVSGFDFAVAAGQATIEVIYDSVVPFTTTSAGFSVSNNGFSFSYSLAKTDAALPNTATGTVVDGEADDINDAYLFPEVETTRLGFGYSANNLTVGIAQITNTSVDVTDFYIGYQVIPAVTFFGELLTTGDREDLFLGSKISF